MRFVELFVLLVLLITANCAYHDLVYYPTTYYPGTTIIRRRYYTTPLYGSTLGTTGLYNRLY